MSGDSISYANAPPRLGRALDITTSRYQVNGQIREVGGNETLARGEATVVVESTMGAADAREVTPGDQVRLGGRTDATIEEVTRYATQNPTGSASWLVPRCGRSRRMVESNSVLFRFNRVPR